MTKAVQQNKLNMTILLVYGVIVPVLLRRGPAERDFHSGDDSRCKFGVYHLE